MFCKNCGSKILENDIYCSTCGELLKEQIDKQSEETLIKLTEQDDNISKSLYTNSIKTLFYGLALIALMVLNTFICYSLFSDINNKVETKTIIEAVNKYSYDFIGYKLSIPNKYIFEEIEDILYIANEKDTINIQIVIEKTPYWALTSDKDKLASMFVDEGYMIVSGFKEATYHNKAFFVGELNYNNSNVIILYTQASEIDSFQMLINNDNNTYDYSKIEEITSILANASFNNRHIEKDLLIDFPRLNNIKE